MTYEEFINQELLNIGVDYVDELFSLGFEPALISGYWKWTQRINLPDTATGTKPHTNVNLFIRIN
jgi:hypothetical protein